MAAKGIAIYRVSWFDRISGQRYAYTAKASEIEGLKVNARTGALVAEPTVERLQIPRTRVALATWLNEHWTSGNV